LFTVAMLNFQLDNIVMIHVHDGSTKNFIIYYCSTRGRYKSLV
jgi:hypothetical protein